MITASNVINALVQMAVGTVSADSDDPSVVLARRIRRRYCPPEFGLGAAFYDTKFVVESAKEIIPPNDRDAVTPGRIIAAIALYYRAMCNTEDDDTAYETAHVATKLFRERGVEEYVERKGGMEKVVLGGL